MLARDDSDRFDRHTANRGGQNRAASICSPHVSRPPARLSLVISIATCVGFARTAAAKPAGGGANLACPEAAAGGAHKTGAGAPVIWTAPLVPVAGRPLRVFVVYPAASEEPLADS